MDIKFENKFYITDKMLKEYVNKVLSRSLKRITFIAILILFFLAWDNILRNWTDAIFRLVAYIIVLLLINILSQKYLFRLLKKTSESIHNNQTYETLVQFGSSVFLEEGKSSINIDYSKIIRIFYLKYSYVLMFTNSNGIMVGYDSFTKGNFEDFKLFIKENCINAKIIVKNKII